MGSFFSNSLLDEYSQMTKEKFEMVVGLGATLAEVRRLFCLPIMVWAGEDTYGVNVLDLCADKNSAKHIDKLLDKWCLENYHIPYSSVYGLLQEQTVKKFEDCMLELGIRGNPSAIGIMNEVIRKKESNSVVTVNFINQLPEETEKEAEDDE